MEKMFMTAEDVREATGLSRTTIWRLESGGDFPIRRKISQQRIGWLRSEILEWAESRPEVEPPGSGEDTEA